MLNIMFYALNVYTQNGVRRQRHILYSEAIMRRF